jgi:hypothetical protein
LVNLGEKKNLRIQKKRKNQVFRIQNPVAGRNTNKNIAVSIFLNSDYWIPITRNIK